MKRIVSLLLVLLFTLGCTTSAFAGGDISSENSSISKSKAMAAALYHVVLIQNSSAQSAWKGKNIEALDPVEIYDASDEICSYVVNLEADNQPVGYVEIANNYGDFPVLSYSEGSSNIDNEKVKNIGNNTKSLSKSKSIKNKKAVCISPGHFGFKVDYNDGSADIISDDKVQSIQVSDNKPKTKVHKQKNSESKRMWDIINKLDQDIMAGDMGTSSDGVTDDISFENGYSTSSQYRIGGVSDVNQYFYPALWTGYSGCVPTAAYNIIYYWHYVQGKTNLLKSSSGNINQNDSILELRYYMGTDNNGETNIYNEPSALVNFSAYHGYISAVSVYHSSPSWSTIKSDLCYGPSILNFNAQTYYGTGKHAVTGMGYAEFIYNGSSFGHQYMIVHDNWSPCNDVYIAYGRNYNDISSVMFTIN